MITPGATPNVTISAKESNCFPSSPATFNFLAKNPSKKSNIAPVKIANGAHSTLPPSANKIATTPESKLEAVNILGKLNIQLSKKIILYLLNKRNVVFLRLNHVDQLQRTQFFRIKKVIAIQNSTTEIMKTSRLMAFCLTAVTIQTAVAQNSLTETIAPKYSNEFLAIGVGADALGLGNSVVAQTGGVQSGYWNPAGLTKVDKWLEAGLMHSEYFAGIAKYDYLGLAHSIDDKSSIGFSAIRFAVDDIPNTTQLIDNNGNIDYDRITTFTAADYGFLFSYARKLNIEGMSVGGTAKIIHRKVGDFAKSWGFGLDAGLQYETGKDWKFGVMARDVTSTFNAWVFSLDNETREVFINTGNDIPENGLELTLPRFIFAGYKKFNFGEKGLYASGELDLDVTTDGKRNTLIKTGLISVDPHIGLSVGFKEYVTLRAGLSNMQFVKDFDDNQSLNVQPNIGIGLNFKNVYLDYAFTDIGDASVALYSHVVSLRLKLNKPKNTVTE